MISHEIPEVDRVGHVEVANLDGLGINLVYTGGGWVYVHGDAFSFAGKRYRVAMHVEAHSAELSPNASPVVESTTGGKVATSRRDAVISRVVACVVDHATQYPGYPLAAEAARKAEEAASAANDAAAALEALRAAERALQVARRDARRATWALEKFRRDGAASRS